MENEAKQPFLWHKRAYAEFAAAKAGQGIRAGMEMLDMILAHAEEELLHYALLNIASAMNENGTSFSGHFNLTKLRAPSVDEFDGGALLVMSGYTRDTPLTGVHTIFIAEQTVIGFQE